MAERGDIAEIRERVDLVELVGARVDLKRSGKNWRGLCPFHTEKTPSFYVYPESGNYICFSCGEKGDAFSWLMKTEGLDFPEALEQLAARTGVTLRRGVVRQPGLDEARERVYALNEEAASFYANVLLTTPAGEPGRRYVAERGLTRATVERFSLGFAPDAWDALLKHLTARGHRPDALVEAGLVTARDGGGYTDRFRARLLFPIRNRDGRIVGFGGRALGDAKPKYLNTAQTAVFDKSANLYAIDLAKDAIRKADVAVIVEGYMDAIMAHQVGYPNVVASMGTALTEAQVGLLKRLTKRIVLALDTDAAGQGAMQRWLLALQGVIEALNTEAVITPDAVLEARRNAEQVIRLEQRLDTEILVMRMPEGKDPDEFLRAHAADWPALVASAEPFLDYLIQAVVAQVNPADARAKSAAVEQLAPLIRLLPNEIQQHHYIDLLARMLRLPDTIIASTVRKSSLTRRGPGHGQPGGPRREEPAVPEAGVHARPAVTREGHLLGLLLAYPEVAHDLLDEIRADDFVETTNRLLWEALRAAAGADARLRSADFLATLENEELREAAAGLVAALGERPEHFPVLLRQEARDTLRLLRQELHDAQFRQLRGAIAEASGADDREALAALTAQLAALLAARRAFDPAPSPYFHDIRTVAEKR